MHQRLTGVDTSNLAAKADLASLEGDVDKILIDKLKTVPTDLSKCSNAVGDDIVQKTTYDQLVRKFDAADSSKLVKKLSAIHKLKKLMIKVLIMINMLQLPNSIN